jgi:dihydropteroate synthase
MLLHCGTRTLDLATPHVMGILNVTPDSFSDGGRYVDRSAALAQARRMIAEGATIIDVGGESTRPGAVLVTAEEEIARVVPVIEAIRAEYDVVVSIDTSKPEVILAAVASGAELINDIRALTEPTALQAAAQTTAAVCLMHMQGQPATMQQAPRYGDVMQEVIEFLANRVTACVQAGIGRDRLLIDPGIGFGKTLEHNLSLLAHLPALQSIRLPVLIGVSRKSMIGAILGSRQVDQRLYGGLALVVSSVLAGVRVIRTHDVAATCDAVRVAVALTHAGYTQRFQPEIEI